MPVRVVSAVIVQLPRPLPSKMARSAGPGAVVLGGPPEEVDQFAFTLKLPGAEATQNLFAADAGGEKYRSAKAPMPSIESTSKFLNTAGLIAIREYRRRVSLMMATLTE